MEFNCGGCDARWRPLNACHCSACHRTFAGPTLFDLHRISDKRVDGHGVCRDPAALTHRGDPLELRDGIWHSSGMTEEDRARQRPAWSRE